MTDKSSTGVDDQFQADDDPEAGAPLTAETVRLLRAGDLLRRADGSVVTLMMPLADASLGETFIGRPDADGWIASPEGGWQTNPVPGVDVFIRQSDGWESSTSCQGWLWTDDNGVSVSAFRLSHPVATPAPDLPADWEARMSHAPVAGDGVREDRDPITHEVKCWKAPFAAVKSGAKPWELRFNDRDYRVGDTLRQREWDDVDCRYTGDETSHRIGWALYGPAFGLPEDYVIMSLAALTTQGEGVGSAGDASEDEWKIDYYAVVAVSAHLQKQGLPDSAKAVERMLSRAASYRNCRDAHMKLAALSTRPSADGLSVACQRLIDDYQTSDNHHPDHVLVRLDHFQAVQAAALATLHPAPDQPGSGDKGVV